jgi:hypothetical protein
MRCKFKFIQDTSKQVISSVALRSCGTHSLMIIAVTHTFCTLTHIVTLAYVRSILKNDCKYAARADHRTLLSKLPARHLW